MCHEWWMHRVREDEEARRLWDEFERTPPAAAPEVREADVDVTLEERDETPLAAER